MMMSSCCYKNNRNVSEILEKVGKQEYIASKLAFIGEKESKRKKLIFGFMVEIMLQ